MSNPRDENTPAPPSGEALGSGVMASFINAKKVSTTDILTKLFAAANKLDFSKDYPLIIVGTQIDNEAAKTNAEIKTIRFTEVNLNNEAIKASVQLFTPSVITGEKKGEVFKIKENAEKLSSEAATRSNDRTKLQNEYGELVKGMKNTVHEISERPESNVAQIEKELSPYKKQADTLSENASTLKVKINELHTQQKATLNNIETVGKAIGVNVERPEAGPGPEGPE